MIYFDNAATTFPKPITVAQSVGTAVRKFGGNPGRSGHILSVRTSEQVFAVRDLAADFFNAQSENVVFTLNCTHAINMAIKGVVSRGDHIIISSLEHNSVSRPAYSLARRSGVELSMLKVSESDDVTIRRFKALIKDNTKAVVMTVCSNVIGQILPYKEIAKICKKRGIIYIADAAQAAGVIPLGLDDGFDFICAPGHKGLYGPAGTGLLISNGEHPLATIIEGGTGATSLELEQTGFLPERLESGTVNTVGIIGLGAGIRFVNKLGIKRIYNHEMRLTNRFLRGLQNIEDITVLSGGEHRSAVVSFNKQGYESNELAQLLSDRGFCLRGGYHCAGLTHKYLGTEKTGAVRFSPSVMNKEAEVDALLRTLRNI